MSTNNTISEAQLAANRLNAQHSTGPTSEAGKARVGLNAVKTGLTGRMILLTAEEAPAYETLMNDLQQAHQPEGILERSLVQSWLTSLGVLITSPVSNTPTSLSATAKSAQPILKSTKPPRCPSSKRKSA